MKSMTRILSVLLVVAPMCAIAMAQEKSAGKPEQKSLNLFAKDATWRFGIGKPGGAGSFDLGTDADKSIGTMKYDFTGGGDYIQATADVDIAETKFFFLKARTDVSHRVTLRMTDSSGQTLQYKVPIKSGDWVQITIPFAKKAEHWGGANDGKVHFPIEKISLSVPVPQGETKTGHMDFADAAISESK